MTKEMALEILKSLDVVSGGDIDQAIQFAINALEQDLCEDAKLETITEFADRCRECGAKYGKLLKQEPILDKIKSEIEQLTSRYSISKERGGMGQVEWSDRLIKESDVLQIIDKYRGEADCRECKAEYECYECEKYEESEVKDAIC